MNKETIEKAIQILQDMLDLESELNEKQNEVFHLKEEEAQIQQELEEKSKEIKHLEDEKIAYENSLAAIFDGLKYVADPNNPFEVVLPMKVYANQFYKYNNVKYVCIQTGFLDETNIDELLTEASF